MKSSSFHILRVGIAITFLWIGILILKEPEVWAGYLRPWVANFLPFDLKTAMLGTVVLDILVGFLLLIDVLTWLAALIGTMRLVIVLVVSGICYYCSGHWTFGRGNCADNQRLAG